MLFWKQGMYVSLRLDPALRCDKVLVVTGTMVAAHDAVPC